nr:adaptor protein MecA [Vagococcus humatus]
MERINENTIRVLIENEDLEERGITFLDLLGNHKEIEHFFYSILAEVDIDEQFQDSDAVTFQVLPNQNGLELFISKNLVESEDGELPVIPELEASKEMLGELIRKQLSQKGKLDKLKKIVGFEEDWDDSLSDDEDEDDGPIIFDYVIQLESFEDAIQLAKVHLINYTDSSLFKMSDHYYIHMHFELTESEQRHSLKEDLALLLEYGTLSMLTPEVLSEYGHCVMDRRALEQLKYYFE